MEQRNPATVYDEKDLHTITNEVFNKLTTVLKKSYGPLGSNTILHTGLGQHPVVTKDGLTILKSIKFEKVSHTDIYTLIRSVSENLVEKVGDGSTSAIILARIFYDALAAMRSKYSNIKTFSNDIEALQKVLEDIIHLFLTKRLEALGSHEERLNVLGKIASISNNNDVNIGSAIAAIMNNVLSESSIIIKENPYDNSEIITHKISSGFMANRFRLAHPIYFSGNNKDLIELNDGAFIVMSYNFLEVHYNFLLEKVIPSSKDLPIVVIADTIQQEVLAQVVKDAMIAISEKKLPKIFLVSTGSISDQNRLNYFHDLESYVNANATLFNSVDAHADVVTDSNDIVGFAKKISFKSNNIINFEQGAGYTFGTEGYTKRIDALMEQLDKVPSNDRLTKGQLRGRLDRLNGASLEIFVGGRTHDEKNSLKYLVEDSVFACRSVIKNGYTLGGNYATLYALRIMLYFFELVKENKLEEIIKFYYDDFVTVLDNEGVTGLASYEEYLALASKIKVLYENPLFMELVEKVFQNYSLAMFSGKDCMIGMESRGGFFLESLRAWQNSITHPLRNFPIYDSYKDSIDNFCVGLRDNTTSVISPVRTDLEVLNATFSIITLLLTSNQYM